MIISKDEKVTHSTKGGGGNLLFTKVNTDTETNFFLL